MKVTKLGVSLQGADVLIANLREEELEKLNAVISELSFEDGLSNEQIFSKIGEFVQSKGELELEVLKSLVVISRLSGSVGYDLVLATEDAVTKQVEEIKFNGIYIRRVSDGEIVYFVPYKFYELYTKYLYSDFPSDFTGAYDERSDFLKDLETSKERFKDTFSLPEDGSNTKVLSNGAITFFWGIYNDDSWMIYGNLFKNTGDSLKLVQGEFSDSVYQLFGLENSRSVSPFWIEADDEDFEMLFV